MKAIQVTFDERLLAALDASEEVQREGRSAVLRRAAEEYLARRRSQRISAAYTSAYGEDGGLGCDFLGWDEEGEWPPE